MSGRNSVYVVAEVGINHEGVVARCADLIRAAAETGADAVKLQTVNADTSYVKDTQSYRIFKEASLSPNETQEMFDLSSELGLDVFTTPGDIDTANWIEKLQPSAWKISSGLITHIPLIRHVALFNRPIYIATGMAEKVDIDRAVGAVRDVGDAEVVLFQCTSIYPAPHNSLNLSVIRKMSEEYCVRVGFSDHSLGSFAACLSVAAGATMIEKHLTIDNSREGYDHKISMNPDDFSRMVDELRSVEVIMGDGEKIIDEKIKEAREQMLRCIVASRSIRPGESLTYGNLAVKRPIRGRRGLEPRFLDEVVGRKATIALQVDDPITKSVMK